MAFSCSAGLDDSVAGLQYCAVFGKKLRANVFPFVAGDLRTARLDKAGRQRRVPKKREHGIGHGEIVIHRHQQRRAAVLDDMRQSGGRTGPSASLRSGWAHSSSASRSRSAVPV